MRVNHSWFAVALPTIFIVTGGDTDYAWNCQVLGYVGTPYGEVLKYDPWKGTTETIYDRAPFDANHPAWKAK